MKRSLRAFKKKDQSLWELTEKSALNKLGYYDGENGIWKMSGGYLTYVSAVKVRPVVHTIHYDGNGGSGVSSVMYTVAAKYEGIHTWTIVGTDMVVHQTSTTVTTKYDMTKPGMDGTETTGIINGVDLSG